MSTWLESLPHWQAGLLYAAGFVIAALALIGGMFVFFVLHDWLETRRWERELRERNAVLGIFTFLRWGAGLPPPDPYA